MPRNSGGVRSIAASAIASNPLFDSTDSIRPTTVFWKPASSRNPVSSPDGGTTTVTLLSGIFLPLPRHAARSQISPSAPGSAESHLPRAAGPGGRDRASADRRSALCPTSFRRITTERNRIRFHGWLAVSGHSCTSSRRGTILPPSPLVVAVGSARRMSWPAVCAVALDSPSGKKSARMRSSTACWTDTVRRGTRGRRNVDSAELGKHGRCPSSSRFPNGSPGFLGVRKTAPSGALLARGRLMMNGIDHVQALGKSATTSRKHVFIRIVAHVGPYAAEARLDPHP